MFPWVLSCCEPILSNYTINETCRYGSKLQPIADVWSFNNPVIAKNMPVIATQGSDDPWSTQGLMKNTNSITVSVAECADCGHCSAMDPPSPSDPENLKKQRVLVAQYLTQQFANAGYVFE